MVRRVRFYFILEDRIFFLGKKFYVFFLFVKDEMFIFGFGKGFCISNWVREYWEVIVGCIGEMYIGTVWLERRGDRTIIRGFLDF